MRPGMLGEKTTYLDGGLQLQKNRLRDKDFTGLGAKVTNFRLQQLNLLARAAAPHLQQAVNDGVQIHFLVGHLERPLNGKREKKKEGRKRTGRKEKKEKARAGEGMTSGASEVLVTRRLCSAKITEISDRLNSDRDDSPVVKSRITVHRYRRVADDEIFFFRETGFFFLPHPHRRGRLEIIRQITDRRTS